MTTIRAAWAKRGSSSRVAHAFVRHPDPGMGGYRMSLCPAYWAARHESLSTPGALPLCRDCQHVLEATGITAEVNP